ncbi:MAG: hypothetical protein Q4B54_10270 [Coriobacteriales bacterium]|nr:hypothetical protein [Coriobacteriales bacterium]
MVDYTVPDTHKLFDHSFGTAYGEVKGLYTAKRPYFALYDEVFGKRVKVFYPDDLLDSVRSCYRNYVRVTGEITFSENGTKREMTAMDIEVVDRSKSVSLADLFGIWGAAAGGPPSLPQIPGEMARTAVILGPGC